MSLRALPEIVQPAGRMRLNPGVSVLTRLSNWTERGLPRRLRARTRGVLDAAYAPGAGCAGGSSSPWCDAVLAIEHREQQVSGADLRVPESVGHRKGALGDHLPGRRAKDAGRLVKGMRAIARRQIDRLTDRSKLAVLPDRRENPRGEAVSDLQAADQQMKWVNFTMLQRRGSFGRRPDDAPGIRGEPFKRWHRRPPAGTLRPWQLSPAPPWLAHRSVARLAPGAGRRSVPGDRRDRVRQGSPGRAHHRPARGVHELVSHSVGTNNRRMQVRRCHPALAEQIPDLPSPREGKKQMLGLDGRAPQHPRLILNQQNELRRITAKQAHQSIMTDRCLIDTPRDCMSASLTHHRPLRRDPSSQAGRVWWAMGGGFTTASEHRET